MKAVITVTFDIEIDVPNEYYPTECDTDEKRLACEIEQYENGDGDVISLISQDSKMSITGKIFE